MPNFKIPKIVGFLLFLSILFLLAYLIPYTQVFAKAGLLDPDISQQIGIYSDLMFFILGVAILWLFNFFWKAGHKYGKNMGFYNKDETFFRRFTYPQIFLLSTIVFGIVFMLSSFTRLLGKGIFGLRVLPQQFSPIDSLTLSSLQIPIAENLMLAFSIGIIIITLKLIAVRIDMSKENYNILKFLFVIIGSSVLGFIWHQTVYGSSEIAGFVVAIFWGLGGLLCIITGSFILYWIMHLMNNFFIDFSRLFSSDVVLFSTISVFVVLGILYFIVYRKRLFGVKVRKNE